MRARGRLGVYEVTGRRLPSEKEPHPQLYRMRIYATDHVTAKSLYWKYLKTLKKLKKTHGEIVDVKKIREHSTQIKNFGIWLRYASRSGEHNMYKEYRDLTSGGAATQCFREMGGRHRARASVIHILRIKSVAAKKCRRSLVKEFHDPKIKFPLIRKTTKDLHSPRFTTRKPHLFF